MFKKKLLRPVALMGISVWATAGAHASHNADIVESQGTQAFIRVIEDGDPMNEEKSQSSPIAALPVEVMEHIFSYLSPRLSPQEMARDRELCSLWCNLLEGQNGKSISHSRVLFDAAPLRDASSIPDVEMTQIVALHMKYNGFAPLQNVFISPNQYPRGTRLMNASDLMGRQDTLDAWYWALFKQDPQDPHALALVMSALPQILVAGKTSLETLGRITSYVKRVGEATRFVRFTGYETQEYLAALEEVSHTLVVRAHDLQNSKDALNTLLDTRDDHRVILSLDGEAFLEGGVRDIFRKGAVLTMFNGDIPENLHHLILSDPFGQVVSIAPYFLSGYAGLTSLDTRGLKNVWDIGDFFCHDTHLTSFDTRGLANLTTVGHAFLYGCTKLTSFDTKPLTHVKKVQSSFLDETGLSLLKRAYVELFLEHVRQNTAAGA